MAERGAGMRTGSAFLRQRIGLVAGAGVVGLAPAAPPMRRPCPRS